MTEARRAKWLLAVVAVTSVALLGLLRWAGRLAADPGPGDDATAAFDPGAGLPAAPAPAAAGTGPDLSFYRALGGAASRPKSASPADGRSLRADPIDRTVPTGAFIVQVMATPDEAKAKSLVDRLARRGYPAAAVAENAGGAVLYRVRVGSYKERVSADTMARKLRESERLTPWVLQEAAR